MDHRILFTAAAFGCALASNALAAPTSDREPQLRFTTGVDYSSGDYGRAQETTVLAVPMSARMSFGKWALRASIPYLDIEGPADIVIIDDGTAPGAGGGGDPTGTPGAPRRRSGLGDTTLAATYSMTKLGGTRAYLDVTGRIRLPTGDEAKGLSSGAVDYGLNAELGHAWRKGGAYVNVGRRFLGDPDDVTTRVDGWQGSVGGWVNTSRKTELGAYVSMREASFRNATDPAEVGAYAAYRFTRKWRVQLLASTGLSDASPDFGTALSIAYRPDRQR